MIETIGFNNATPCVELQFTRFDGSQFRKVCYDTSDIDFWMDQYDKGSVIFKNVCKSYVYVEHYGGLEGVQLGSATA